MNLRRLVVCTMMLPLMVVTSGCEPTTIQLVMRNKQAQAAVLWVARETALFLVKNVLLSAIVKAFSPTDATAAPQRVAEEVSSVTAWKAFDDLVVRRNVGDMVELRFPCRQREDSATCTVRFEQYLLKLSQDRVQHLDVAFSQCQFQAGQQDPSATDNVKMARRMNDCVAAAGFAEEVNAVERLFAAR